MKNFIKILFLFYFFSLCFFEELPTKAAEKISFNYGLLGFSVSVDSLAAFAEEGKIDPELDFYLKRLSPEQRDKLREFLRSRYPVKPLTLYRYSRTSVGEKVVDKVGDLIRIPPDRNGFYGVRGSLVQSAADPDGLNIINFLRNFPTDIQLNTPEIIKLVKQVSQLDRDTQDFMTRISQKTEEKAISEPDSNLESHANLVRSENINIEPTTLEFQDGVRDRKLTVDLYLPKGEKKVPLIFISNGIGANRNRFKHVAQYLVANNFAVVIPDHPGSNDERQKEFLSGLYSENFDAEEFIDRPLDISYTIDRLQEMNRSRFNNRLNLKKIGIFGYSFGGTTALSLAGAKYNLSQLEKDCGSPLDSTNISILYQCRILELPREKIKAIDLKDKRIKAAFLFVPFSKSLFGESGMSRVNIPVFWLATDRDAIAPLMLEQVPAFSGLTNREKYLTISQGLPHALITLSSTTDKNDDAARVRSVMETYLNTLSLIFFKVHVDRDEQYRLYLQSSYLKSLSKEPYILNLIEDIKELE